jgi:hypothetical protein
MAYNANNPNGQATSANSSPVVVASDQSVIRVKSSIDVAVSTGTITTSFSTVAATFLSGVSSVFVSIYGTYAGINVTFEVYDGTSWFVVPAQWMGSATPTAVTSTGVLTANSSNLLAVSPILGMQQFRVRATAWTSGTANVIITPSAQPYQYMVNIATLPALASGANTIGSVKVTDGTNTPAVKPASTAAATTDPALVVAMSPNSALGVFNSDLVTTISIASATNSSALTLNGQAVVTVHLTGAWVANVQIQVQADGSTWSNVTGNNIIQNALTGVYVTNATITANGVYQMDVAGFAGVRIIATSYTSGTITGAIRASIGAGAVSIEGTPTVTLGTSANTIGTTANATTSASGSMGALNAIVDGTTDLTNYNSVKFQITGTWTGTVAFTMSMDGTNWISDYLTNDGWSTHSNSTSANGIYYGGTKARYFRLQMTSYTSGSAIATILYSAGVISDVSPTLGSGNNTVGSVGISPLLSAQSISIYSNLGLTNSVVSVKGSAAHLHEFDFYNPNSSGVWVQLFNVASAGSVTLGTTPPVRTIYIPPTSGRDAYSVYSGAWSNGLFVACTTTASGSTAPTSPIQAYIGYV